MLRSRQAGLLWAFGLALLLGSRSTAAEASVWNPEKTWVFAISTMEMKFRELDVSKEGRQDEVLIQTFKDRGVPEDHVVFLEDKEGTLGNIRKSFKKLLEKTAEGDFLIFYFQGHGGRDIEGEKSKYYFCNYDSNVDDDGTYLYVSEVYKTIEKHFKGSAVLLTADCCTSGGLIQEAKKRNTKLCCACLTSVNAHNGSTGCWTFTRALIAGFSGSPMVDIDGDRVVTMDEFQRYIELEMAYAEEQKAMYQSFNDFDDSLQIAKAKKKSHEKVGTYVEALEDGEWYRAKIEGFKDDKFKIYYPQYDQHDEVTEDHIRELHDKHFKVDAAVLVLHRDGKWYPATVLEAKYNLHKIHWDDDKSAKGIANEWVARSRIKRKP
jgi:hypothetical protein